MQRIGFIRPDFSGSMNRTPCRGVLQYAPTSSLLLITNSCNFSLSLYTILIADFFVFHYALNIDRRDACPTKMTIYYFLFIMTILLYYDMIHYDPNKHITHYGQTQGLPLLIFPVFSFLHYTLYAKRSTLFFYYFITMFTSFPETTITFIIFLPSVFSCIFGRESASSFIFSSS